MSTKKRKVFIGVTAYDQKIFVLGMMSILNNIKLLESKGYEVELHAQMGDCYVDQTRNHVVKTFLSTDATDLIFIDNDLSFDGDAMLKLLEKPVEIIGAAYPYRSQDKDGFPVSVHVHDDMRFAGNVELGIIDCKFVPTGLLRIRRSAFDKLKEAYPDNVDAKGELQFFRTGMLFEKEGDKRWFGEDVYFCESAQRIGIVCWCEPTIGCMHIGQLNKTGRLSEYLKAGGQLECVLKKFEDKKAA
jgi:hypothetical protein